MDWASDDYTQVYADTFRSPPPGSDSGIYLLDEAGRDSDPNTHALSRAPIRRYGPPSSGDRRYGDRRHEGRDGGRREGYYTGGNIVSDRGNSRAVFDVAWDERPLHYNPHAGAEWAHLVPPPLASRGPPAFPLRSPSEGLNNPGAFQLPGAPSRECFAGARPGCCGARPGCCGARPGCCGARPGCDGAQAGCNGTRPELQFLGVLLLVVVVVLLAMTLAATGRLARNLEKTVRSAAELLGALRAGGLRGPA